MTVTVLDFTAKVIGPLGAALIAWAGVSHTVLNSRLQDTAKEWHQDLRWALELCASEKPLEVAIGTAALDELSDHRFLNSEQVSMVNRIGEAVVGGLFNQIDPGVGRSEHDEA